MAYEPRNDNSRSHGRGSSGSGPRRSNGRAERHGFRRDNQGDSERRGYGRDGENRSGGRRWENDRRDGQRDRRDGERRGYGRDGENRGERRGYGRDGERRGYGRDGENRGGDRRGGRYNNRRDDRDNRRGYGREERDSRPPQRVRVPEPPLPEGVDPSELDPSARSGLRALGRQNAENVARHLIMTQRLLETDPEAAYQHARYAASHAGRIAVVREAAGISAYLSEHYTEALRDIRAARRLSGAPELHRAIEVDCERALGRSEQALQVAEEANPKLMDDIERAELAMVVSGVRQEMGQTELALIVIEDAIRARPQDKETLRRLHSVRADRLEELGRVDEANAIRDRIGPEPEIVDDEEVAVFDIEEDYDAEMEAAQAAAEYDEYTPAVAEPEIEADLEAQAQESFSAPETDHELSFEEQVQQEMAELLGEDEE